jgi:DNA-binding PadR family transcriptional regulator
MMNFQFDEMICSPGRLAILATLMPGVPVSFTEMKAATSLSDGNLHAQTRKLANAAYMEINKSKKGRRSVTQFRITELGRDQLKLHVVKLQKIINTAAKTKRRIAQRNRRPDDSAVWA